MAELKYLESVTESRRDRCRERGRAAHARRCASSVGGQWQLLRRGLEPRTGGRGGLKALGGPFPPRRSVTPRL